MKWSLYSETPTLIIELKIDLLNSLWTKEKCELVLSVHPVKFHCLLVSSGDYCEAFYADRVPKVSAKIVPQHSKNTACFTPPNEKLQL